VLVLSFLLILIISESIHLWTLSQILLDITKHLGDRIRMKDFSLSKSSMYQYSVEAFETQKLQQKKSPKVASERDSKSQLKRACQLLRDCGYGN